MTENNKLELREQLHPSWEAINWNNVDDFSKTIFDKLCSQFWLDTKIPLSNDVKAWGTLTAPMKKLVLRVFTGLTKLDTIQGRFGAPSLTKDATSLYEEAIYSNIGFMENIHAKSYSSIFSTLSSTKEINESFLWSDENEWLLKKINIVMSYYQDGDGDTISRLRKKVVSVFLESFLFYSGFYLPLYLNGQGKLTNTADIIRLIMRDEALHGYYIGSKFQVGMRELPQADQDELKEWAYDILQELYENEVRYTQDLYDELELTEDVKTFLRYNANRALMNLGLDPLFPKEEVNPVILGQLDLSSENVDFFSGTPNYIMGKVEELTEDDFDF